MTAQNTETTAAVTEAPATGTTPVAGAREEFARLAPTALKVGPNVRDQVDTETPDFRALVDSITEHGVLQAISAIRDGESIVVIDGQQRTLAAIEAAVESAPSAAPRRHAKSRACRSRSSPTTAVSTSPKASAPRL